MTYEIKKGVPMSNSVRHFYPFGEMEVGDCFDLPAGEFARVSSAAVHFAKRHNRKFSIRKQKDGSYSCWRTA